MKAIRLMSHIVAARRLWLFRMGAIPQAPASLFAEGRELDDVKVDWREVQGLWVDYLTGADDTAIERVLEYKSMDADRFRNRIEDILAQLYGHSWYHRGQLAMLIRASGGVPAITDLIYWCREPVAEPTG